MDDEAAFIRVCRVRSVDTVGWDPGRSGRVGSVPATASVSGGAAHAAPRPASAHPEEFESPQEADLWLHSEVEFVERVEVGGAEALLVGKTLRLDEWPGVEATPSGEREFVVREGEDRMDRCVAVLGADGRWARCPEHAPIGGGDRPSYSELTQDRALLVVTFNPQSFGLLRVGVAPDGAGGLRVGYLIGSDTLDRVEALPALGGSVERGLRLGAPIDGARLILPSGIVTHQSPPPPRPSLMLTLTALGAALFLYILLTGSGPT